MKYLLQLLGKTFAALPEGLMSSICTCVGWLICVSPWRRKLVAYSNLSHCFPEMSKRERDKIALESTCRMVEMALFVVASPYMTNQRLRSKIKISDYVMGELVKNAKNPRPTVILIPHFAMMETITMFPLITDIELPRVGVFYRPFDSIGLESWVKDSRERFGIELVSRKAGILNGLKFLKENGCLAVLFDQNAGGSGADALFFGMRCPTTELPGIFVERQNADCAMFYARRTGFWSSEILGERMKSSTIEDVTVDANLWLEKKLTADQTARFDWLWLHRRWKGDTNPSKILQMLSRKSLVELSMKKAGLSALPRKFRIMVTAPESLSDSIALLPTLRALRNYRKDAQIILVCDYSHTEILAPLALCQAADKIVSAPSSSEHPFERRMFFRKLREMYPDVHLVFKDSLSADIEAFMTAAPHRFAIQKNRSRLFMRKVYKPDAAQECEHVALEYEAFVKGLGMACRVDYSPLSGSSISPADSNRQKVALLCGDGTEWSYKKWGELAEILNSEIGGLKFEIFSEGKNSDRAAFEIAKSASDSDIKVNSAKSRADFVRRLSSCAVAVGVDAALLHAANALGARVVSVCGSGNSIRNGLVFDAPKAEVFPSDCPPQGGSDSNRVSARAVAEAVMKILSENK